MLSIRHLVAFAIIILLASALPVSALYTPNPAGRWAPQRFSILGDFQYNAKNVSNGSGDIDYYGFYARPSFSPIRNMSVYGRIGFQDSNRTDVGFGGGVGIQYAYQFERAPEWAVGGSFDFHYWAAEFENSDADINWAEFQIAPAVSYAVQGAPGLVPYGGFVLNFVDARGSLSEETPFGLLFGLSYDPTPHWRLEAQARFITENGLMLSAGYTF